MVSVVSTVCVLATSVAGVSANAAYWETRHVHVPDDSASYNAEVTIDYSKDGVVIKCTSVSSSTGSLVGCSVRVKCLNNGEDLESFNEIGTYTYCPDIYYVPNVTYRLSAYTETYGATFTASGTIESA